MLRAVAVCYCAGIMNKHLILVLLVAACGKKTEEAPASASASAPSAPSAPAVAPAAAAPAEPKDGDPVPASYDVESCAKVLSAATACGASYDVEFQFVGGERSTPPDKVDLEAARKQCSQQHDNGNTVSPTLPAMWLEKGRVAAITTALAAGDCKKVHQELAVSNPMGDAVATGGCTDGKITLTQGTMKEDNRAVVFCKKGVPAIQATVLYKGEENQKKTTTISMARWQEIWALADAANWKTSKVVCTPDPADPTTQFQKGTIFRDGAKANFDCEGVLTGPWKALQDAVFKDWPEM